MVVSEYEYADLATKSRDKRSHNFIFFSMSKLYFYPVNPLCAMAAQGMKISVMVCSCIQL